ncbi:GMP synthase (glutamine-hydrolyzing) [Anaerosolibacter carboniphilus]|uniref:GMP synthase (Glutamine-hydrolyzing) n=1 Tax=Anaerosolibacter carboniphilus TaxID=1417629 RepID=A0A841KVA8_9FIRM|nr:glutamine amidotransferase [Anaerosolibacter carboniphilus]MBB6216138.1 GMP synthase (glutamine-hydrolyzing) [Anaerosolibacter carboniphilus]
MKKILIIKTGTTFQSIREKYGDFEDLIIKNADLRKNDVKVWDVQKDISAPAMLDIAAIIITGSHSMVTDCESWSVMLAEWLREVLKKPIPTLGICYGHQLLAHTFGGTVDYHPKGRDFGTVEVELTEEGKKDPLLGVLSHGFLGHVAHSQSVLTLPSNARVLAKNDFESHHAFGLDNHIWGVQFHPEFKQELHFHI